MAETRITLNLTGEQNRAIEEGADRVGLTKAMYLRQAVELMNQLAKRKGAKLYLKDKDEESAFIIMIPGITGF